MDKNSKLCMGCMSPMEKDQDQCPVCSYHNDIPNPAGALPAGSVLDARYMVGRVFWQNSVICAYIGLDIAKGRRVYIEEFMPVQLARRTDGGQSLWVEDKDLAQYKTMLSDLADCWRRLAKMDNRCLPKIRDIFTANESLYCVETFIAGATLEEYLQAKGALTWPAAKTLLMPLFSLVSNLHNKGLVHGGISPSTVMVDQKGRAYLTGFALPELRTDGSGVSPELFGGYSAPEQYSKNLFQGEWTDIYSLGALLYRALTQTDPPAAPQRGKNAMESIATLRPDVPEHVSLAVAKAMEPAKKNRFRSVDEFTAALLEETSSNTAVFHPEPAGPAPEKPKAFWQESKNILTLALVVSIILNLILAAAMVSTASQLPPEEETSVEEEPQPAVMEYDLTGMLLSAAQGRQASFGLFLEVEEERYSETVPENVIMEQTVQQGQLLPDNMTVGVVVSKGSAYVDVPYLIGCSELYARKLLAEQGLPFDVVYDENPDTEGIVGTVVAMNKGMGDRISKEYFDTEKVTITVKKAPSEEPEE